MGKKQIAKLSGNSLDVTEQQIESLKSIFPQAVKDGKIDFEALKKALGEEVTANGERYGLNWAGKSDCFRHIQETTTATLKPVREESIDFDNTENIFIEGDNLQVLKALQKSYYGKIKMIYIDPPYNTGNDSFIYPDKFAESKEDYLQRIGDKDVEGNLIKDGFWRKNSKDSGHFHSNWLSMMHPRLFLARNLLSEDGIIFVSIDDNEVHNLKMVMNEIYGDNNFVCHFVVQSNPRGSQSTKHTAIVHEYILCYAKNFEFIRQFGIKLSPEMIEEYSEVFEDGRRARLLGLRQRGGAWKKSDRPLLFYPIYVNPKNNKVSLKKTKEFNIEVLPIKPTTNEDGTWRWNKEKVRQNIELLKAKKIKRDGKKCWDIYQYDFLEHEGGQRETKPKTIWLEKDLNYQNGTTEVKTLFKNKNVFDFPKPTYLTKKLVSISNVDNGSYILDFFAGSCSTADAVMQLNAEDGGDRKFICIQLPEPCDENSEAYKAGYKTIADIGKERIRRAAKKIKKDSDGKSDFESSNLDLGFKVFKLEESNFKQWRGDIKTAAKLKKQMSLFVDNIKPETLQNNILYELILKTGLDLNVRVQAKKSNRKQYFVVDGGKLIICLDEKITKALVDKIIEQKPEKFLCLDRAFESNDQLKTNTALQMESEKIEFKVI